MEGADSFIVYLPEEEEDAQETKKKVEEYGGKCHLLSTDLKDKKNCKTAVEKARETMGAINVLVNNHAYQMMVEDIQDLTEYERPFDAGVDQAANVLPESNGSAHSTQTSTHSSISQSTPSPT